MLLPSKPWVPVTRSVGGKVVGYNDVPSATDGTRPGIGFSSQSRSNASRRASKRCEPMRLFGFPTSLKSPEGHFACILALTFTFALRERRSLGCSRATTLPGVADPAIRRDLSLGASKNRARVGQRACQRVPWDKVSAASAVWHKSTTLELAAEIEAVTWTNPGHCTAP